MFRALPFRVIWCFQDEPWLDQLTCQPPFLPKSHCFCWFCPLNYNIHPSLLCYSVCNYDMLLSWTLRHQACWILLVYLHNSPASLLSILRVRHSHVIGESLWLHSESSRFHGRGDLQKQWRATITRKIPLYIYGRSAVAMAVFKKRIDMDWRFIWQSTWNHLKYIYNII